MANFFFFFFSRFKIFMLWNKVQRDCKSFQVRQGSRLINKHEKKTTTDDAVKAGSPLMSMITSWIALLIII